VKDIERAARVLARADELAEHSASPEGIERAYLTPQHARVNAIVAAWMREAGLRSWPDAAGNQCGRRIIDTDDQPAILLGSHLDTVPGAGRYDGILGVLVAIEVADMFRDDDLAFALEVVAFGDEEGTRFGTTLLGSRALAGGWNDTWLELRDRDGISLREAATTFGLIPENIGSAARSPNSLMGYLECHIEQGPRLESLDRALGVVTTIAAAERRMLSYRGEARHGATPWELRHDALLGASEAIVAIERIARDQGSHATVGRIRVEPDAVNVIPGFAEWSLDLRDATAASRDATWGLIRHELHRIAVDRGLDLEVTSTHVAPEAPCDPTLREFIARGIAATGDPDPVELVSIAGHDAMAMADLTLIGMLFVRCKGGISHHADESVREEDVAAAIEALAGALGRMDDGLG
jgi:allantoate deiminase